MGTVSAILPNYNDALLLPRALDSLVNQRESYDEIIIIDDASTDHSLDVIYSYMSQYSHIRLIKHAVNQGVTESLNDGIRASQCEYIHLCAADDCYAADIVFEAKKIMEQFPHVGLICGDAVVSRFNTTKTMARTLPFPAQCYILPDQFAQLSTTTYVGFNAGGGMFMLRQAVLDAGMLHSDLRWYCDWMLYFVIALRHGIFYQNSIFIHMYIRQESYSNAKRSWKVQKQTLEAMLVLLDTLYADCWLHFKSAGLFPDYSIHNMRLIFSSELFRRYLTVRLFWKFIINNKFVIRVGRLFPYHLVLKVRKLLKA